MAEIAAAFKLAAAPFCWGPHDAPQALVDTLCNLDAVLAGSCKMLPPPRRLRAPLAAPRDHPQTSPFPSLVSAQASATTVFSLGLGGSIPARMRWPTRLAATSPPSAKA